MEDLKAITLNITALAFGGAGIGKLPDGKICFVRGTVPGEVVEVLVTDERPAYAYARLISVKKASPARIHPECPLAIDESDDSHRCPGCSYGHLTYETELNWKQKQLEGFLVRTGIADKSRFQKPEAAQHRYGWRNKIRLTSARGNILGYKEEDNTTVLDVPQCPLARKSINDVLAKCREEKELPPHITFRWTLKDGVIVRKSTEAPDKRYLTEQMGKHGYFSVPENSFFQINVPMATLLAEAVSNRLKMLKTENLLELFCGVGVLSLIAASENENLKVSGLELDKTAVDAANLNARRQKMASRCSYFDGDAAASFSMLARKLSPDKTTILIDPPRCGIVKELCTKINRFHPHSIIYVSCAPDTLARDLKLFLAGGYEVCDIKLFDMFPTTAHFETLTVLRRNQ